LNEFGQTPENFLKTMALFAEHFKRCSQRAFRAQQKLNNAKKERDTYKQERRPDPAKLKELDEKVEALDHKYNGSPHDDPKKPSTGRRQVVDRKRQAWARVGASLKGLDWGLPTWQQLDKELSEFKGALRPKKEGPGGASASPTKTDSKPPKRPRSSSAASTNSATTKKVRPLGFLH
jgi:hypothetical protein